MFFRIGNFVKDEFARLLADRSGVTLVEYGLLVAFISAAMLVTFVSIGETLRDEIFPALSNAMQSGATEAEQ